MTQPIDFNQKVTLGRTGLKVGQLGISSSFGAPAGALEAAFDRGCNYFTWGTFIKGRSHQMNTAIRNIGAAGRRDDLVVAMLTYAHHAWPTEHFFVKGLADAHLEHADILVLGYFPKRPPEKVIDGALKLKEKGLVRHVGLTSHNRRLFPDLAKDGLFDVFHVRYNATHHGAESGTFPYLTGDDRPGVAKDDYDYADDIVSCAGAAFVRGDLTLAALIAVNHLHAGFVDPNNVYPPHVAALVQEQPVQDPCTQAFPIYCP